VAKQQLNLLKLVTCGSAELGADSAEIMGSVARNASCPRVLPEHLPDHLLA
jgi:hypothetical protein